MSAAKQAAALLLTIVVLVLGAPTAHADEGSSTPFYGCVAHREYRHVKHGMSRHKVERIFHASGRAALVRRTVSITQYRQCHHRPGVPYVAVTYRGHDFSGWHLSHKEWGTSLTTWKSGVR